MKKIIKAYTRAMITVIFNGIIALVTPFIDFHNEIRRKYG